MTEILYRMTYVPGFDQPFTDQQNFGNYIDTILMNKINKGGWVAINCIPTAVHTVAGAIIGKIMIEKNLVPLNTTILIWAGISLFLGYVLDWTGITPIIKRIATTSFTVFAGMGFVILAFFYWWVDIKIIKYYAVLPSSVVIHYLFICFLKSLAPDGLMDILPLSHPGWCMDYPY